MTVYRDLEPCEYFDSSSDDPRFARTWSDCLQAVGWLGSTNDFPTGPLSPAVLDALRALMVDAWQPARFLGWHECELCLRAEQGAIGGGGVEARRRHPSREGTRNVFIPGGGVVFVAPEMIVHYVSEHGYQPPAIFCRAVLDCPPMNSAAYFDAVRQSATADFARFVPPAR